MTRRYLTAEERQIIRDRAFNRCEYCLCWDAYSSKPFQIDHIDPISRGGNSELDNLAYACGGCNGHKYNKTEAPDPTDNQVVPLFNPRKDSWEEHFAWNDTFTHIVGLTPTGRATVHALQLNRRGVVNIRELLRSAGKHPPERD